MRTTSTMMKPTVIAVHTMTWRGTVQASLGCLVLEEVAGGIAEGIAGGNAGGNAEGIVGGIVGSSRAPDMPCRAPGARAGTAAGGSGALTWRETCAIATRDARARSARRLMLTA